jgi:hypothetical protein
VGEKGYRSFDPETSQYILELYSHVSGPVREKSHVVYKVDDLAKASEGLKVLLELFEAVGGVRVGFMNMRMEQS